MSASQQTELDFLRNVTGWEPVFQLPALVPVPVCISVYGTFEAEPEHDDELPSALVIIRLMPRY